MVIMLVIIWIGEVVYDSVNIGVSGVCFIVE